MYLGFGTSPPSISPVVSVSSSLLGSSLQESKPKRSMFLKPIVCSIPMPLIAAHVPPVIIVAPLGMPRSSGTLTC